MGCFSFLAAVYQRPERGLLVFQGLVAGPIGLLPGIEMSDLALGCRLHQAQLRLIGC
jgi:hypothetical protein